MTAHGRQRTLLCISLLLYSTFLRVHRTGVLGARQGLRLVVVPACNIIVKIFMGGGSRPRYLDDRGYGSLGGQ